MKLDSMDYLRQQIEASLGRSEELILLDKAKCGVFYRYPGEPAAAAKKRSSKERGGTFNSVRLKKYLGLGSKSKQKGNKDDVSHHPQQHPVYIGELQRYGSYYSVETTQFPVYHPEYHRRKPLPYDSGTVRVGRSLHYPNMYASVSVRSPQTRGTVYGVYPWPEPYSAHPVPLTNMAVLTELSPMTVDSPESFDCPCTCEESVLKSKRHRNTCTCTPGTRSRWWTKRLTRPSLFHGGNAGDVGHIEGIKKLEGQVTAKANQYEQSPSARSRLHRLSDLSSLSNTPEVHQEVFSRASADFHESAPSRKSILECPVNPYELIACQYESSKQTNGIKKPISHDYEDLDDRFSDLLEKDTPKKTVKEKTKSSSKGRKSTPNAFRSVSAGRRFRLEDDDTENDVPDISLGGQRIRLFGTVNGIANKVVKRPSLPSFTDHSTADNDLKQSAISRSVSGSNRKPDPVKTLDSSSNLPTKTVSSSDSSDDWHIDDDDDDFDVNKSNKARPSLIKKSSFSPESVIPRKTVQHKTKIAIGGSGKNELVTNSRYVENEETVPPSEPTYVNVTNDSDYNDDQSLPCHTVISIGQETEPPSRSADNKLNLRINFSELSAYLKPILKKSPFVESSSSSSEAEGSETYSSTQSVSNTTEQSQQKQKKHVHFLSNRQLSSSSELTSPEDDDSEGDVRHEGLDDKADVSNVTDEDSDPNPGKEGLRGDGGGSSESEEEILSSSSSTQDLYDDGISIANQSDKVVDDRVVSWTPEPHLPGLLRRNEKASWRNAKFAASIDDMAVVDVANTNSDAKKFNLRRSLSERQVAVENMSNSGSGLDDSVDRSTRLSPVRSNSFQTVASMKSANSGAHRPSVLKEITAIDTGSSSKNSIPGKAVAPIKGSYSVDRSDSNCSQLSTFSGRKGYLKSSPAALRKKYVSEDISHQQQPLYQNSCSTVAHSQMVANIIAKCNNNNISNTDAKDIESRRISSPMSHHRRYSTKTTSAPTSSEKLNQGSRSSSLSQRFNNDFENHFHKHFDSLDKRTRSRDDCSVQPTENNKVAHSNRTNSSSSLAIAKMKAIPKFLPRPSYSGKHVPVCSRYDAEFVTREGVDKFASGWSSEDELYTDGSSILFNTTPDNNIKRFDTGKCLPPVPVDRHSQSKSDDSDDNGIYEQIGEPLYEEVPDTLSYSSGTSGTGSMGHPRKSIFEGASKTEILSYLEDAKERGVENIPSTEETDLLQEGDEELENEATDEIETQKSTGTKRNHRNRISNLSNLSDSSHTSAESFQNEDTKDEDTRYGHSNVEVERNDSGVGSETSKPSRLRRQSRLEECSEQICVDCDLPIDKSWDKESDTTGYVEPLVCKKCCKKRCERKEIILEFVETEYKYGRDLRIIKEEFHRPMLVAGLLSEELLSNIFLNLDQLIEVNDKFTEKLKDALDIAAEHGDEDYNTVNVGKIFLDSSSMLPAFEAYCVRQGTASMLLTNLEKEKELLRIFLKVSQMENTLLRRLNLNSFLMVPVQRVTKYPLLINRLYKVTPHHHQDREALREAQLKIELHLEHINQQAKDLSGMNLWRRISNISNPQRRNLLEPVIGNIKMRKMALEILQWNNEEVRFVMEGRLQYTQINENLWNKREKSLKLTSIHGLLITLGNPNSDYRPDLADREFIFPRNTGIREATLVLIKEKNSRFNLVREPLPLQRCVISCDPEVEDMFEVQEFTTKDAYLLKADDVKDTQEWLKMLRYHAKDLGAWRRRRNALANIMINGMAARREWL